MWKYANVIIIRMEPKCICYFILCLYISYVDIEDFNKFISSVKSNTIILREMLQRCLAMGIIICYYYRPGLPFPLEKAGPPYFIQARPKVHFCRQWHQIKATLHFVLDTTSQAIPASRCSMIMENMHFFQVKRNIEKRLWNVLPFVWRRTEWRL